MTKEYRSILAKITGICFLQLFFLNILLRAQTYPPYTTTIYDSSASTGYYFLSPKRADGPRNGINETHMILDKYGDLVYVRKWVSGERASDFKMQSNGLITYSDHNGFKIIDSTFTIIDSVQYKNGIKEDGHDFQILPNGHFLLIGAENITMDLRSYHIFLNHHVRGSANAKVRCGVIQEQDENKNVVFEWHAKDYFAFDDIDETTLVDTSSVDWNHCNAVELDYDGNILLSTRRFNEITKINRSDSSIMWRLGGKKNQFNFTNDSVRFLKQHDIRRLANGNITLFDNGYGTPLHPALASEYMLDENQLTATLAWQYTYGSTIFSDSRGNVQRLANGNTIVDYGDVIGSHIAFNCVDTAGTPLFEIQFIDKLCSYRAFNYPTLPWKINRPKINCEEIAGQVYLSVDSGYSSYLWSTGETTFKIAITSPDTFYVFVPTATGGFLKSEKLIVTDLANPCDTCHVPNQPGLVSGYNTPCFGTTQTYSVDMDSSVTGYTWALPQGWSGSSTTNSISVTVGAASGYISVVANNACGSSLVQNYNVSVSLLSSKPGKITGNSTTCPNTSYTYSVTDIPGATNYTWSLPAGWSGASSTNSINVITDSSGGIISVYATNVCGPGLVQSKNIAVNTNPVKPSVITGSNFGVCGRTNVSYSVLQVNGMSYNWSFSNSNASIIKGQGKHAITVNYNSAYTTGVLSVSASNDCAVSPNSTLAIKSVPKTPGVITGPTLVCQQQQGVGYSIVPANWATSYTWTGPQGSRFSDGITTSTSATFTTTAIAVTVNFKTTAGFIKVKANNACGPGGNASLAVTFNCRETGLSDPGSLNLAIAPNPVHDMLNISFVLNSEDVYQLFLTDLTGRLLKTNNGKGFAGTNVMQMDVSNLGKGTYLLQLRTASGSSILRVEVN